MSATARFPVKNLLADPAALHAKTAAYIRGNRISWV
ncbi:hypothetical protein J2045_000872 [Peteryoungia aggregata LMG 23059]|uniref:Uncharacterized protein n=1 Tax=Peteryoungia aggregata LMG 23059 TaxID=1368425 RepID=A0ABU0G4H7_9HYPH|nr:hypothetical protein [Peteryoungia aggregata LMG 23059]